MKFGIVFANIGPFASLDGAATAAKAAEAAGFESIWTVEHVVVPSAYESTYPYDPSGKMPGSEESPIPDPLMWLSAVGAVTSTIRLATGVLILPQRNPVVLAKEVATLDSMTGGRVELGVGVGWLEEEFKALGIDFHTRGKRTDDYIRAMRTLWSEPQATYSGEFCEFTDCVLRPQPASGSVPIHIGGHTDFAAKRAGRLGDGFFPGRGHDEELAGLITAMRQTATDAGRDPDAIEITSGGGGVFGAQADEQIERLSALGVTRVVVPSFLFWNDTENALAQYGEEIIARHAD